MPQYELAAGGFFLAMLAIGMVINLILRMGSDRDRSPAPGAAPQLVPEGTFHFPSRMSTSKGIAAWWRRRFVQRPAWDCECLFDYEDDGVIAVTLPLPRCVTRIDIQYDNERPVLMKNVQIETVEGHDLPDWTGKWQHRGSRLWLRLEFDGATPLTAVRLTPVVSGREGECRIWLNSRNNPDEKYIKNAQSAEQAGDLQSLERYLVTYQDLCPDNPVPALRLAHLYRFQKRPEMAEIQALRAIAANRSEQGSNICRELAAEREWGLSNAKLDQLRQDAAEWGLDGHHGLVALRNEQHFLVGPGNFLRERHVSAVLVRRRAAARKLTSVTLPMVTGWGGLLFTAVRVRRHDGSVDAISDDKFTVGSADDDNPFIAVARRRIGTWILPDLAPGDVVELAWDKVQLGQERPFMLANLGQVDCPTLCGRVTCTAPPDRDVVCAVLNTDPGSETATDFATDWSRITVDRNRIIPRRSYSDPFQRVGLNPVVGFAARAEGWDAMGAALLGSYYEAAEAALEIPERLKAAFAGEGSTREKLARAFYWIRDNIKYASVASHHEVLMSPERAAFVVESGMGDCKDVSYLLALVCRDLGVPWEFALMSTENGVVLEELPSDQFDHVILRAEIDGEWHYLDVSGSAGLFGAPPSLAQGMSVLCGRHPYLLATVPVAPADRTRIAIRQTLEGVEDGWLQGSFEARLEGYPSRLLDENWKHHSLTAVDPDRAADETVRSLLPDFCLTGIERRQDTANSDVLHLEAQGRHVRLVALDGKRIAAFGFAAPGLFVDESVERRFRERFIFPYRLTLTYELVVAADLRDQVRAVSVAADLDLPICRIRETQGGPGEAVVLRREIVLREREITGEHLDQLPELLNRMGAATRVVVALA